MHFLRVSFCIFLFLFSIVELDLWRSEGKIRAHQVSEASTRVDYR